MKEYMTLPDSVLTDSAELNRWLGLSYVFTQSLPVKNPKKK